MQKNDKFFPKTDLVIKYREHLDKTFQSRHDSYTGQKITIVDDKVHYLTGPFSNKSRLSGRMYWDVEHGDDFHEPSLRKAIKDWITDNSQE